MTAQQDGKWFEHKVAEVLKKMMVKKPIFYHRLVDSNNAGRFVQPQPSDFLVASKKVDTIYLELKSTGEYASAKQARHKLLSPAQVGKSKLVCRAEQAHLTLFYSTTDDVLELWLTETLIGSDPVAEPYFSGCFKDLESMFAKLLL